MNMIKTATSVERHLYNLADAESLLGSLLHLWRLRTPSTSNRTYSDISKFLRTIIYITKMEQKKVFVLAALEPICSCALRPFDATLLYIRVTASGLHLHKKTPRLSQFHL